MGNSSVALVVLVEIVLMHCHVNAPPGRWLTWSVEVTVQQYVTLTFCSCLHCSWFLVHNRGRVVRVLSSWTQTCEQLSMLAGVSPSYLRSSLLSSVSRGSHHSRLSFQCLLGSRDLHVVDLCVSSTHSNPRIQTSAFTEPYYVCNSFPRNMVIVEPKMSPAIAYPLQMMLL